MKFKNIIVAVLLVFSIDSFARDVDRDVVLVDVVKSTPVYENVTVRIPYEEVVSTPYEVTVPCIAQERHHRKYSRDESEYKDDNSIGLDTIIGAGIGIAIGNQIGKGNGRTAAKVAGGVLGAVIANKNRDSDYNANHHETRYCKKREYRDEVVTKYEYKTEKKLVGYENVFIYNGKRYTKVTPRPKRKIKVVNSISF